MRAMSADVPLLVLNSVDVAASRQLLYYLFRFPPPRQFNLTTWTLQQRLLALFSSQPVPMGELQILNAFPA